MNYATIAALGKEASVFGVGGWQSGGLHINQNRSIGWQNVSESEIAAMISAALSGGLNIFDTADSYGPDLLSAVRIGRGIKHEDRKRIVIHAKVGYVHETGPHRYSRANLLLRVSRLVDALRTDHIDILGFHHSEFGPGYAYLDEAADTVKELKSQGIVQSISLRFGHSYTGLVDGTSSSAVDIETHKHLVNTLAPEFCTANGSWIKEIKLPDFEGTWLLNKVLHQGILLSNADRFVQGDNRVHKSEFSFDVRKGVKDVLRRHNVTITDILAFQIEHAQELASRAIIFIGMRTREHVRSLIEYLDGREKNPGCAFVDCQSALKKLLAQS